LSIIKLLKY